MRTPTGARSKERPSPTPSPRSSLPSRRRASQLALLAPLAAVWAGAAWYLWRTPVPSSLRLPDLNAHFFFSAAQIHRSASFGRVSGLLWLGGMIVELGVFALYAWRGARFARESAAGPIGTGMLLGMLGFALLWIAELPFQVVTLWWERRHGLAHGSYWAAIFRGWLALGGALLFLCAAPAIVMGPGPAGRGRRGNLARPPLCGPAAAVAVRFPLP